MKANNPQPSGASKVDFLGHPRKMFIGGLSSKTTKEGLQAYFSKYGDLRRCLVVRDRDTKQSRGFGFVTFEDPSALETVLKAGPHDLDHKKINPEVALPRRSHLKFVRKRGRWKSFFLQMVTRTNKIFVGGVSASTTEKDLTNYFKTFGSVTESKLVFDKVTNRHRGFGFVTFQNEDDADSVCEKQFHVINNKKTEAKKAQPRAVIRSLQGRGGRAGRAIGGHRFSSPGHHAGFMDPADQRRTQEACHFYANFASINNQRGRSGPNMPPDIPQVTAAMPDYTDYSGGINYHPSQQFGSPPLLPVAFFEHAMSCPTCTLMMETDDKPDSFKQIVKSQMEKDDKQDSMKQDVKSQPIENDDKPDSVKQVVKSQMEKDDKPDSVKQDVKSQPIENDDKPDSVKQEVKSQMEKDDKPGKLSAGNPHSPPTTKQTEIVRAAMKFESEQEECVRVLPYEENDQMVVHLYVFSGESGIPESLKEAAYKCFGEMDARLKWFDLYNDAAYILNVTSVEYPSGVPQVLNASQVDKISEIISQNLDKFDKHRNITSVQASFKVTDLKETENPCITINVLGKGHVPIGESEFPVILGSYPVDVVQGFWFRTSDPWWPNEAQTPTEELRFGASLGVKDEDASGTLGAIVKDAKSGTLYALSCDHVMQHAEKSEIIHPGLKDYRNYLQYHLNEYKSSVGRIVDWGCSEMKFSVEGLQEPEMKEKFEALKEKKDNHLQESGPEAYPRSILAPITKHETALETGFSKQPRIIGTYITGLRRNVKWSDGKEYFIDAAVAELNVDEVTRLKKNKIAVVIGTGNYPSGECCPATTEDVINTKPELCKSGRTTGYTEKGRLAEVPIFMKPSLCRKGSGALHDVQMHNYICQECAQKQIPQSPVEEMQGTQFSCKICGKDEVWWKNCLCIEGRLRISNFVAPGDSGAVIFEKKRDDENAVTFLSGVGILFAQHENQYKLYGIASPLVVALQALSQKLSAEHNDCDLRMLSNY